MEFVWILLMAAALGLLAWWAYRSDPHWAAKDGRTFTCRLQLIGGDFLIPEGRWRDARAEVDDNHLIVRPRGMFSSAKLSAHYRILKRETDPPKGYAVYLVDGGGVNGHQFAALRIPATSRAVPLVDSLIGAPESAE